MVMKFAEGFDVFENTADMQAAGISSGATKTYATTGGRFGGGCIVGTSSLDSINIPMPGGQGDSFYIAFAYWHDGGGGHIDTLLQWQATNGGKLIELRHDELGNVTVLPQDAISGTASPGAVLTPNEWSWVELYGLFGTNSGTDGQIRLRINEIEIYTNLGCDTCIGTLTVNAVALYGGNSQHKFDDIIVFDDTTTSVDSVSTFTGDIRIDTLRPTSNGTHQDWTANTGAAWDAVNDTLHATDNDTTYITSTTINHMSTFNIEDPGGNASNVIGAQVKVRAKKTDNGARNMVAVARNGTTTTASADPVDPGTAYKWVSAGFIMEDPNTGGAFTPTTFNATQFGVKVNN